MAPPFVPTLAPYWVRVFASATSLCWLTLRLTKFKGSAEVLGESGAMLLYLPTYLPDFNPIEQAYAKLKALLRKAAARTVDGMNRLVNKAGGGSLGRWFSPLHY